MSAFAWHSSAIGPLTHHRIGITGAPARGIGHTGRLG